MKTSDGLLVRVKRRWKMCPSGSTLIASPGGSYGGVVDCSSIVYVWASDCRLGVEGGRDRLGLVAGGRAGGFEMREVRLVPELSCSLDTAGRNLVFLRSPEPLTLVLSWSRDKEGRSRGFLSSPPRLEPAPRLSLEAECRMVEVGLGRTEGGFGIAEVGRGRGSLDKRGIALMRF